MPFVYQESSRVTSRFAACVQGRFPVLKILISIPGCLLSKPIVFLGTLGSRRNNSVDPAQPNQMPVSEKRPARGRSLPKSRAQPTSASGFSEPLAVNSGQIGGSRVRWLLAFGL